MLSVLQADALGPEETRARWMAGALDHLLRPYQRDVYDGLWDGLVDPDCLQYDLNVSRRWGKTTLNDMVALEVCYRVPGAQVRFAAPTGIELRKRTLPIMRGLLQDCPPDLRPSWNGQDKAFTFFNGSEIHIAGVNNDHEDDLRGTSCHIANIDEAGYVDRLSYLIDSVLAPQTLDTGGTIVLGSTPPPTPAHDYCEIAQKCEAEGWYAHRDIFSMGLPVELLRRYQKQAGCRWELPSGETFDEWVEGASLIESSTWQREYLAQFVVDSTLAVVPEWREANVREVKRDEFFLFHHKYSAMDLGVRDFNATLFGYYDFRNARLVIEDEWIANGPELTSDVIEKHVREREKRLGYEEMRMRVADNNNVNLLVDLAVAGLPFGATSKELIKGFASKGQNLMSMVNMTRMWVKEGRIVVHPRCSNLLGCLKYGVWKDIQWIGRELGRSRAYGHYDALMALVYLVRNVDTHSNPIPADFFHNRDGRRTFVSHENAMDKASDNAKRLREVFSQKRKVW